MTNNTSSKKILIVDDDEDDFFITSEYIKSIASNTFWIVGIVTENFESQSVKPV